MEACHTAGQCVEASWEIIVPWDGGVYSVRCGSCQVRFRIMSLELCNTGLPLLCDSALNSVEWRAAWQSRSLPALGACIKGHVMSMRSDAPCPSKLELHWLGPAIRLRPSGDSALTDMSTTPDASLSGSSHAMTASVDAYNAYHRH